MSEALRVLIVDDDREMADTLLDILRAKGHDAETAHSGPEALDKIGISCFDCVLTDIKMPRMDGVSLFRAIKAVNPDQPVVLMTAYAADSLVAEGLGEGAVATLTKPLDINLFLDFLSVLRKQRSIVLVDDDARFCGSLADILEAQGFDVTQITEPHDVVGRIGTNARAVLLDMKLNGINGLDLLKEIRATYPHLPVILMTGYKEEMASAIKAALKISAATCLYKPLQIEELIKVLREVHHQWLGMILGRTVDKRSKPWVKNAVFSS